MTKEDILEASRQENKNKDLVELDISKHAHSYATMVGAIACCVLLVLASVIAKIMLYGPWFIYFSMLGTSWLIRSIRLKKKSDWILTVLFIILAGLALIGSIIRLVGLTV